MFSALVAASCRVHTVCGAHSLYEHLMFPGVLTLTVFLGGASNTSSSCLATVLTPGCLASRGARRNLKIRRRDFRELGQEAGVAGGAGPREACTCGKAQSGGAPVAAAVRGGGAACVAAAAVLPANSGLVRSPPPAAYPPPTAPHSGGHHTCTPAHPPLANTHGRLSPDRLAKPSPARRRRAPTRASNTE